MIRYPEASKRNTQQASIKFTCTRYEAVQELVIRFERVPQAQKTKEILPYQQDHKLIRIPGVTNSSSSCTTSCRNSVIPI